MVNNDNLGFISTVTNCGSIGKYDSVLTKSSIGKTNEIIKLLHQSSINVYTLYHSLVVEVLHTSGFPMKAL